MPTIDAYKAYLYRSDYSLLFLAAAVALCVLITIRLWRHWPRFRTVAQNMGYSPGVFFLAAASPLIGLLAALTSTAASLTIKLPRFTFRPILLAALLLRLPLMFQGYWYDEAFTERLTTLPLDRLFPAILSDTHPPLYYSAIWLWSRLAGHSEFMLRLPSLVYGLLAVYLLYRLVIALGLSERSALIAAALCAITPSAIYYSTEARSYAMLTCAVLGALICIFEDRPKAFVVCVAFCGWLHHLGLFYVPVLLTAAWILHSGDPRQEGYFILLISHPGRWRLAIFAAIAAACVWLPLAYIQSGSIADGFWIYFNSGTPVWMLTLNLMYLPRAYILPILLPYIALLAFGFYISRRRLMQRPGAALLVVMIGAPALAVLASMVWAPVFLPRIFLPITLLALIPLAYALDTRWQIVARVAAPVLLASVIVFYSTSSLLRPDFRPMVAEGCSGATAMFYTALDTAISIAPYWSAESRVWNGGTDRGLTFKPEQMPLFGFQDGEISELAGRQVCIVYVYSPRTLQSERDELARLLAAYPHTSREYPVHSELKVDAYVLQVKS